MVMKKLTKGRQKIEIKPIQNEAMRQVCFSKRRPSLFKKASELSILCGAEVAVIIFFPGGKSFSFGHPSVCSVADRFLAMPTLHGHAMGNGCDGSDDEVADTNHELNQQLVELQESIEAERQRKHNVQEAIERVSGGRVMQRLIADVGILGLNDLEELKKELSVVQGMVDGRVNQMLQDAKRTKRPPPQPRMHVSLASQILFGWQRGRPMHTMLPGSANGPYEWVDVNSMITRSLGGHGSRFNGSFGG